MDISAMDPKDIPGLFDAEVVGPDGEKVGTIQQIFADEVTGAATFVTVLSQGHEYFIPVRGACNTPATWHAAARSRLRRYRQRIARPPTDHQ
jgi:hypothetical protein